MSEEQKPEEQVDPATVSLATDYKEDNEAKGTRLEKLNCWPTVKNMIEDGKAPKDIATYIQQEAKEYTDVGHRSLWTIILRYISKQADKLIREQVAVPHMGLQNKSVVEIDSMSAVNLGLATHLDRIMIDYATEKKIKKTINSNTNSLKVLNDMLKTKSLLEMRELEKAREMAKSGVTGADSGVNLDDMARLKAAYATKYGDKVANIVFSPESRRRVLNALEKVKRGSSAEFIAIMKKKRKSLGLPETDATDIVDVNPAPQPPVESKGEGGNSGGS